MSGNVLTSMAVRRPAVVGAACAGALLIGGVGGVWAAGRVDPEPPAAPPATRLVSAGGARLQVPQAWDPVRTSASTTVLAPAPPLPDRVIVTVGPPDHASLIARSVRDRIGEPTVKPVPSELGGRAAWSYRGLVARTGGDALDVTVLPWRDAVLTVACVSPLRDAGAMADCAAAVGSVSLGGGPTYVPAPDLAFGLALPRVLRDLDGTRQDARAALASARSGPAQARLAERLAQVHRRAADALRPVAGPAGASLVAQLTDTSQAYRTLADAVGTTSAARLRALREGVRTSDERLARAVAGAGARPRVAADPVPRPPVTTAGNTTPGWLFPVIVLCAGLVFVLVTLRLRRPYRSAPAPAPVVRCEPAEAAVPFKRWDAPPDDGDPSWPATPEVSAAATARP